MLKEYFQHYIKNVRNLSQRTVGHYITGINAINTLLEKYHFPIQNLFDVHTIEELNQVKEFISKNEEFLEKNRVGNQMYSAAFKHFYKFVVEDELYDVVNVGKLDIIVPKPQLVTQNEVKKWKRNKLIVQQVIKSVHYCCEIDNKHTTFISSSTGKNYVEGHHLIPMQKQEIFENSLDNYANIISLCPNCHRLLHHGVAPQKEKVLKEIFQHRRERFVASGIDLRISEFLKCIG